MLDRFAVRIVPASQITGFAEFFEDTDTIELSADTRPDMLPHILRDADQLSPHYSRVPILASVQ